MADIIQWNCRGLRANIDEIQRLSRDLKPSIICLQETLANSETTIPFRQYSTYNKYGPSEGRSSGGVATMISHKTPHQHLDLDTELQAVAVTVTLHRVLTICNVYIPPNSTVRS